MKLISKGDAVTYALLVATAVSQAADPFRKEAAMPSEAHPFLASHVWAYLPIVLLSLVALIWFWRFLPFAQQKKRGIELVNPSVHFPTPDWHEPLKPIVNQIYRNETIEIDGKAFHDCLFENVTFLYNGTKPTQFINCRRPVGEREYTFQTDNPEVLMTFEIVHWLRITSGEQG
ncbi:MAG: hypothetical protein WA231_14770, partial [Methylocella sp.]